MKLCCRLNVHTGTYFRASMVQICCRLNMHSGNFSGVSLCSSAAGYTYKQKPTLGFPGEALFQTTRTLRNLLSGISNCSSAASKILLQLCCQLDPNEALMLAWSYCNSTNSKVLMKLCCQLDLNAALMPVRALYRSAASYVDPNITLLPARSECCLFARPNRSWYS